MGRNQRRRLIYFSSFISVLPRASLPELSHGAVGEFDLPVLRGDRLFEAALLQDSRWMRGSAGEWWFMGGGVEEKRS